MSNIKELSPREGIDLAFLPDIPAGAYNFSFHEFKTGNQIRFYVPGDHAFHVRSVGKKKYTPLGIATELSEEVVRELVRVVDYDLPPSPSNDFQGDWSSGYMDYESQEETGYSDFPFVKKALESWASLLRANGIAERWLVLRANK